MKMSDQNYTNEVIEYYNSRVVKLAFKKLKECEEDLKKGWKNLAKMYSPSGGEIQRAKFIYKKFLYS